MNTRPDMSYAVGLLSRFGSHPTVATCKLMVYALQYLRSTVHMDIRYSGSMFDLYVFIDADWAGDVKTRRSTTGNIVFAAGGQLLGNPNSKQRRRCRVNTRPPMRVCRNLYGFGG